MPECSTNDVRRPEEQGTLRRPANDDRESIGQILRTLQRRPARTSYIVATVFAVVWVVAGLVLGWVYLPRTAGRARPDRPDRADAGRAGRDLLRADHLLLRARPHGLAVAGIAADRPVDGRGRHAARRAGDRRARIDRHRRPGDPPRGRRHGRRHRARAGARRRARDAGGERGVRARARLQRQRSAHPRAAAGSRQPARHAGRPGRADPRRHQQRASRSRPRHFPDQRAGGRAGQRGLAAHHPYARREGRAHHPRARTRRRHHDRDSSASAAATCSSASRSTSEETSRGDRRGQRPPDRRR